MAWIPSVKIDGGLYAGRTYPDGDLTGFISYLPQKSVQNRVLLGNKLSGSDQWFGKFGISGDLIIDWWESHLDGTTREFDLIILDIDVPEGAQFYKQELVITCKTKANAAVRRTVTIGGVAYEAYTSDVEFGIQQIKRYEYATPYSTPTVFTFMNSYRGAAWRYKISGDDEAATGNNVQLRKNALIIPISYGSYEGKTYFCVGWYVNLSVYTYGMVAGIDVEYLDEKFGEFEIEVPEDPNDEDPPEDGPGQGGDGGGEGDHVLPDGPVLIPDKPYFGVCSPSWLTCYKMSGVDINEFGEELVSPNLWEAIGQFFTDPINAIVGISLVPVNAPTSRTRVPKIGTAEWSRAYNVVSDEFVDLDCGAIEIPPYWDSCFDFNPFTKITIFLPYIGYKELNADEVMGGRLGVKYRVDVVTGDLIAFVYRFASDESIYGSVHSQIIAQYNGNCATRIPTGRISHDGAINASLSLMTTGLGFAVAAAMQTDGLADAGNIGMSQAANQVSGSAMSAISNAKLSVERSGGLGSTAGYIGSQKPYIIRQIPRQSKPKNYKQICGYPCNKEGPLSNFETGTLAYVEDIQLNNIPALEDERREIMEYLRGGVIL